MRVLAVAGLRLREADLRVRGGGRQALLQPIAGGLLISVDPTPPRAAGPEMTASTRRHRTRFLISHEIGHTFFYELSARRPRRLLPVGSAAEEEFCTEFARALLIPPEAVAQTPPCADTVFELAQRYDVSVELAARTFAAFHQRQPQVALGYWTKRSRKVMLQWATPMPGSAELLEGGPDQSINRRTRQVVAVALPH